MRLTERLKKLLFDPAVLSPPPGGKGCPTDISLIGRGCVEVSGCKGIAAYGAQQISLFVKEGILSVHGSDLTLKTYRGGCIAVCGQIDSIDFSD